MIILQQILLIYPQLDFIGLGTMLESNLKLIAGGMGIQCKTLSSNEFVINLKDICTKIISGDAGSVNAINNFLENACKVFNIQRFKQLFYMSAESMNLLRIENIDKLKSNARGRIAKNGVIFKNWSNIVNQARQEEIKKQESNRSQPALQSEAQLLSIQLKGISDNLSDSQVWVKGNNLLTGQTTFKEFYNLLNSWYVSEEKKDLKSFRFTFGEKLAANKELNKELIEGYEPVYLESLKLINWANSDDIFFFYNFRALYGIKKNSIGETISNTIPLNIQDMKNAIEERVENVINNNQIVNNEDIQVENVSQEDIKEVEERTETQMSTTDINNESKKMANLTDSLGASTTIKGAIDRINKNKGQNLVTVDDLIQYVKNLSGDDDDVRVTNAVAQMLYSKNSQPKVIKALRDLIK